MNLRAVAMSHVPDCLATNIGAPDPHFVALVSVLDQHAKLSKGHRQ